MGLLHGICGLEGGTNMLLYNFKKAFVYFDKVSKAMEAGMLEMNLLQESYLIVLPVSSLPTYLFV